MAKIARFYGWSHMEIMKTPYGILDLYYKAITHLEAEEMMCNINVVSTNKMKGKDKQDFMKKLDRFVFKGEQKAINLDAFAGKLNGRN